MKDVSKHDKKDKLSYHSENSTNELWSMDWASTSWPGSITNVSIKPEYLFHGAPWVTTTTGYRWGL